MKTLAKWPIYFYRFAIKPLIHMSCRHYPSCSSYAMQAIEEWGPIKGWWLSVKRISKCHPWGTSGIDLVPKKKCDENTTKKK